MVPQLPYRRAPIAAAVPPLNPARFRAAWMGLAALGLAFALPALASSPASAHEHLHAGELEFTVGWSSEPPLVYQANGIEIRVERTLPNDTVEVVEGVAGNITVTIATGPSSALKGVDPAFGRPGWYTFPIVPTRAGAYRVTIAGTIDGTAFNVSGDIEGVALGLDVNFPVSDPTARDLEVNASEQQAEIAALRAQVAALEAGGGGGTQAELDAVRAEAATAYAAGVAGALAGLAGAGVGAAALRAARGRAKP